MVEDLSSNRYKFPCPIDWKADTYGQIPIEMTVALPCLNVEKIIWLALESLKNQKEINFGWELIIMEEFGKSVEVVKQFLGQLPNCQQIRHFSIIPKKHARQRGNFKHRFLLIDKWIQMALLSDSSSRIFVLQAADCYSPPKRLSIHYHHFKHPHCYYSTQLKGIFYNLKTKEKIIYDGKRANKHNKISHLNMALLTADMRNCPTKEIAKGIDNYIRRFVYQQHLEQIKKSDKHYISYFNQTDKKAWKGGVDTDGMNQISISRKENYLNPQGVFNPYKRKPLYHYTSMSDYLPPNVVKFLKEFK